MKYTVEINLYTLDELSTAARNNAIMDHRIFLINNTWPEDFISGDPEYDTPEQLEKVYRDQIEYYEDYDEPIIESIEANEYLFYANGEIAHITHYTGGPCKGETHLTLHGEIYEIL